MDMENVRIKALVYGANKNLGLYLALIVLGAIYGVSSFFGFNHSSANIVSKILYYGSLFGLLGLAAVLYRSTRILFNSVMKNMPYEDAEKMITETMKEKDKQYDNLMSKYRTSTGTTSMIGTFVQVYFISAIGMRAIGLSIFLIIALPLVMFIFITNNKDWSSFFENIKISFQNLTLKAKNKMKKEEASVVVEAENN